MEAVTKTTKTIEEIIGGAYCPLPINVIPNNIGINLVSVESISWTKQEDGQLVSLTINFLPNTLITMKKKQTAVDWLIEKVEEQRGDVEVCLKTILYQCYEAKQMEREQIEVAFAKSYLTGCEEVSYNDANKASENYYKETYGEIQC
jgi:hypothetical protein